MRLRRTRVLHRATAAAAYARLMWRLGARRRWRRQPPDPAFMGRKARRAHEKRRA